MAKSSIIIGTVKGTTTPVTATEFFHKQEKSPNKDLVAEVAERTIFSSYSPKLVRWLIILNLNKMDDKLIKI